MSFPLVILEFYDTTHDDGWKNEQGTFTSCAICKAVGWEMYSDKVSRVLVMLRSDEGNCSERLTIPKGAIIKRTVISSEL